MTKKRIKPGRIEPSKDGNAIVVHFTNETTYFGDDGEALRTEKEKDKREVPVAKLLRGAQAADLPSIAEEIVEKCRYIPATKTKQVEQVLAKLHAAQAHSPDSPTRSGGSRSGSSGHSACAPPHRQRPAEVLPFASIDKVEDYGEELYEETMELKARGAQCLLSLCTEAQNLETISQHVTVLGVLSRELRENAKRSHELAVSITGIFLCLAHFSQFHGVLVRHQCSDVTMRVVEYESRRRNVLQKELDLARGRIVALGSAASKEQNHALARDERRYQCVVDKQDKLLQLSLMVLRDLAEDYGVERKLVGHKICQLLVQLMQRQSEDMLIITLAFLHKLTVFEVNKNYLNHQVDALKRLAELTAHAHTDVAILALRVLYNLSFDHRARSVMGSQTNLLATLVGSMQRPHAQKVSRRLLYHLSQDSSSRSTIAKKHPQCVAVALHSAAHNHDRKMKEDAVALCINLATEKACAMVMVKDEKFPKMALKAIHQSDPLLLKVVRHIVAHPEARLRMLSVMREAPKGGPAWLHEIVRTAVSCSDNPEVLVEALGILANLDLKSPEVPWPELCEVGLLDMLHRLLMVGFSEDDVLLECIMVIGIVARDAECAPLLATSRIPAALPSLLTEKQEDGEITLQLLFVLRCLLVHAETSEVVLHDTDAPDRVLDLLHEGGGQAAAAQQAVAAAAEETIDLIVHVDRARREPQWVERIKVFKFELHNDEWCMGVQHRGKADKADKAEKADHRSARAEQAPKLDPHASLRWNDVSQLENCRQPPH